MAFLNGYFYWSGVVINAIMALAFLCGFICTVLSLMEERRYWKEKEKYGTDGSSDIAEEEIGERYRQC